MSSSLVNSEASLKKCTWRTRRSQQSTLLKLSSERSIYLRQSGAPSDTLMHHRPLRPRKRALIKAHLPDAFHSRHVNNTTAATDRQTDTVHISGTSSRATTGKRRVFRNQTPAALERDVRRRFVETFPTWPAARRCVTEDGMTSSSGLAGPETQR